MIRNSLIIDSDNDVGKIEIADPAFVVVCDGPLSDEALAALATLLLDSIEFEPPMTSLREACHG